MPSILNAADEFEKASKESLAMVGKLEKVAEGLRGDWTGASQEAFHKHLDEWTALMKVQAALLTTLSLELRALVERYERADRLSQVQSPP